MFVKPPQVSSLGFHKYLMDQMGLPPPNTNAPIWSCARILSLHLVPLFVVLISCGDAKCLIIAGVVLVVNVGQRSSVDKTTSSFHGNETTLVFDVRTGHAEATTFNACLFITIINDIVVVDDNAPNATVRPCASIISHLLDQIFISSHVRAYGSPCICSPFPPPFSLNRVLGAGPKQWGKRGQGVRGYIHLLCHLWDICIITFSCVRIPTSLLLVTIIQIK